MEFNPQENMLDLSSMLVTSNRITDDQSPFRLICAIDLEKSFTITLRCEFCPSTTLEIDGHCTALCEILFFEDVPIKLIALL
jgi:hypothetical protein